MMTNKELLEHNKNRVLNQFCAVTKDLDKTMKTWVELFKIGPWQVMTMNNKTLRDLKVGGKLVDEPFEYRVACSMVGDMQIELIQPVYGPPIYAEFIERRGEGLHHIKEKITDEALLQKTIADYEAQGIKVMQTGYFFEDVHYYLDTEGASDIIFELGNCPDLNLPEDMYYMYPDETE